MLMTYVKKKSNFY